MAREEHLDVRGGRNSEIEEGRHFKSPSPARSQVSPKRELDHLVFAMIVTIAPALRPHPPRLFLELHLIFPACLCACIRTNAVATDHIERLTNMHVLQRSATTTSQLRRTLNLTHSASRFRHDPHVLLQFLFIGNCCDGCYLHRRRRRTFH